MYFVFVLTMLAAAVDGFGITLLLPLIDSVGIGDAVGSSDSAIKTSLQSMLAFIGIGYSMFGILVFIGFVILLKGCILFASYAYETYLEAQLLQEIKSRMFDKYAVMDFGYYSRRNTGHFINIINSQIAGLIASFRDYRAFLASIISAVTYLVVAFVLAPYFALMAAFTGFLLLLFFRGINNYVHSLSRKTSREKSKLNKFLVQTLQAFKYLASTAEVEHLRTWILRSIGNLATYMRRMGYAKALTRALTEPVTIFFVLIVIIVQVHFLEAPLAPILVALVLFNRAIGGIMRIQKSWQSTLGKIGSLEMVEKEFKLLDRNTEQGGSVPVPVFESRIEIKNICFSYRKKQNNVLQDVSLLIPANSTVALVGESGAGKSTLVDVLTLMLKPQSGQILIDGLDSGKAELTSWRRQIGYVSQETVVFDDTIANNICVWKDDWENDTAARKRIVAAARKAHASDFIERLPDGYMTSVGDRGVRLSGGQRQRLFLARELYKQPRLLILDEATSALDSESEHYIRESIDALRGQTTVVIIAHRLSTIKNADYIYVMEQGRIIEAGDYETLSTNHQSRFKSMVELQSL